MPSGGYLIDRVSQIVVQACFDDVSAASALERHTDLFVLIDHAEEHDTGARLRLLKGLHGLKTVESWHADVEDDGIGIDGANRVERLASVGRGTDNVAVVRQQCRDPIKDSSVIVDEENAGLCAVGPETRHRHGVRINQLEFAVFIYWRRGPFVPVC